MPESEPRRAGISFEVKPHAYDPTISPELFEGVLARRVLAFFIDVILIAIPVVLAGLFIFVFGLVTFGLMDIEMRTWYGAPLYFLLGAVHAIVFWISISALTPLILLVGLFNDRGRLLHDMLVGTVVINNEVRANALRVLSRREV
jgi:uncharacterized RDD family membrane protein YckC